MHQNIIDFLQGMRNKYPDVFTGGKILECGSMEVSGGTPRGLFHQPEEYIGIDWREGKCVDVVSIIHEYRDKPDGYFDVVISTQTLEHDPYWIQSVKRMIELVKEGGALILTYSGRFGCHCPETSPINNYYEDRNLREVIDVIDDNAEFETVITSSAKDILIFLNGKK